MAPPTPHRPTSFVTTSITLVGNTRITLGVCIRTIGTWTSAVEAEDQFWNILRRMPRRPGLPQARIPLVSVFVEVACPTTALTRVIRPLD